MKTDIQLEVEVETIIPKVDLNNCHILQSHLNWYRAASKEGAEREAKIYEGWLRTSVANAKRQLAGDAMREDYANG